jgi:hypothetical protein
MRIRLDIHKVFAGVSIELPRPPWDARRFFVGIIGLVRHGRKVFGPSLVLLNRLRFFTCIGSECQHRDGMQITTRPEPLMHRIAI